MPDEKEQVKAREEHAPARPDEAPRGNVHSEADQPPAGTMPPPMPN